MHIVVVKCQTHGFDSPCGRNPFSVSFILKNNSKTLIYCQIFKTSRESEERGLSGRQTISIYYDNIIVNIDIRKL